MSGKRISLIDRLQKGIKVVLNGCWEWQGCRTTKGYGWIRRSGTPRKMLRTHRAMWEIVFSSIPKGLCVLHRCDNPPCVKPAHLFLGTSKDNMVDKVVKGRSLKGENHVNSKLTWDQVRSIRADARSCLEVGSEYEISSSQVSNIKRNKQWKEDKKT